MKARSQRTHYMGSSNRNNQDFDNSNKLKTQSIFERSFNKSKSLHFHQQIEPIFPQPETGRIKPFLGTHNEFETQRFDKKNVRPYKYSKMIFPPGKKPLTMAPLLNSQVIGLQQEFKDKKINMHKLKQLKRAFVKNNRQRRNLQNYFKNYEIDGIVNEEGLKKIVKQYGFDINDDEAKLIFRLTNKQEGKNSLNLQGFVKLMTRDDIFYETLQINQSEEVGQSSRDKNFSEKVHQVLRNKFPRLKQAFKIYRQRNEQIGLKQFEYVMKKLDLTDLVLTEKERNKIFHDFSDERGQFNVEGLICAIAAQEHAIKFKKQPHTDFYEDLDANKEREFKKSQQNREFDMRKLSSLQYERQYSKARSVIEQLTKMRIKKKQMKQDPNIFNSFSDNGYINRDELLKNTEKILRKEGINFHKEDYESFAAYLNYDVNGNISLDKLHDQVFLETEKQAMDRFERKVRMEAPKQISSHQSVMSQIVDEDRALQCISKLKSHKMNPETRQLFKFLDKDHDGYISEKQFKQKLRETNIMENWQIQNLSSFFKLGNEGYINYKDFSKRVNEDLSVLEKQFSLVKSRNAKSCHEWLDTTKNKNSMIKTFNQIAGYQRPTKFSAWPQNKTVQDLSLIQPNQTAGMFISENERFAEKKEDYGMKQKMIAMAVAESRRQKIANWNNTLQQRVQINREKEEQREAARNYALRLTKQKYELSCHQ